MDAEVHLQRSGPRGVRARMGRLTGCQAEMSVMSANCKLEFPKQEQQ